jgi:hypothetical protein
MKQITNFSAPVSALLSLAHARGSVKKVAKAVNVDGLAFTIIATKRYGIVS